MPVYVEVTPLWLVGTGMISNPGEPPGMIQGLGPQH